MASESKTGDGHGDDGGGFGTELELSLGPGGDVSLSGAAGFEVEAITSCPHVHFANGLDATMLQGPPKCATCEHEGEVWVCLTCGFHGCSRFVEGHAAIHHDESSHPIAVGLADMSAWCYLCRSAQR